MNIVHVNVNDELITIMIATMNHLISSSLADVFGWHTLVYPGTPGYTYSYIAIQLYSYVAI